MNNIGFLVWKIYVDAHYGLRNLVLMRFVRMILSLIEVFENRMKQ